MKRKTFKEIVKTNGAKRVALSGVMLALALIVSLIENMIPPHAALHLAGGYLLAGTAFHCAPWPADQLLCALRL